MSIKCLALFFENVFLLNLVVDILFTSQPNKNEKVNVFALFKINATGTLKVKLSVYFVVKTAVGANTERKSRMAERKTASYFGPAERPKGCQSPTTHSHWKGQCS